MSKFDTETNQYRPDQERLITSTKEMTSTDHLSHVWGPMEGRPALRERFLERYGQYFEDGRRITR